MKKILTGLQAICGIFGTLGTVGEMEVNYEMTIGEGALQAVLFLVGIVILQLIKSNYPKQKQKSAPGNHTHFLFTWRPKYNTKEKICQGVRF